MGLVKRGMLTLVGEIRHYRNDPIIITVMGHNVDLAVARESHEAE